MLTFHLSSPYKANVSNFPSKNIWDGSHGRLHAPDGLSTGRRQTIQVQIYSLYQAYPNTIKQLHIITVI